MGIFLSNVPRYFASSEQAEFEDFLQNLRAAYFVATLGGTVVACGGYYVHDGVGRLCWGMVSREKQGASVGTTLLAWRLDHLFLQTGVSEVSIDTSQHTKGFFARHGFRTSGHTKDGFGVGLDQVSMTLQRDDWQLQETARY